MQRRCARRRTHPGSGRSDIRCRRYEHQSRDHPALRAARRGGRGRRSQSPTCGPRLRKCSKASTRTTRGLPSAPSYEPRPEASAERSDTMSSRRPPATLSEAMAEAADRDRIARQYVSGFEDVFDLGERELRAASQRWRRYKLADACALPRLPLGVPGQPYRPPARHRGGRGRVPHGDACFTSASAPCLIPMT